MDSARWQQIQALFHRALDVAPGEREAFVAEASGTDSELASEVLSMIREDSSQTSLLNRGLPDLADRMLGASVVAEARQEFGPYCLKRILGEGGMGVVWLAERRDAGNEVAIKFLPHAGVSPSRRDRFRQEIRTLGKLKHPFIASLYDAGTLEDGTPWFVMEYVPGVRLTEYCDQNKLSVDERIRLFCSVCQAVRYAHGQEIIHRDLKPSNILVDSSGAPRLLDFGIAKELQALEDPGERTGPGFRMMSREYASPEWIRDGSIGFFTDVYSLGVILFKLLTGRLPAKDTKSASRSTSDPDDAPCEVPSSAAGRTAQGGRALSKTEWGDLDVLCLRAMHPDPGQRYPSVEALIRDLDHYLRHEPLEARPESFRYRAGKFITRNRNSVFAASLLAVFVFSLVVFFTFRLAKARNSALAEAARTARIQRFMLSLFRGDDKDAGPAQDLRVVTLIDHGVREAQSLNAEPEVQADLYQTLGTMYQKLGHPDRAAELLKLSLKTREFLPEKNHEQAIDSRIALGLVRSDQGNPKGGERIIRGAIALIDSKDANGKALLGRSECALGQVLVEGGNHEGAVKVLHHAVALISAQDENSPELAEALTNLGDAYVYLGRYNDADAANSRALAIYRQVYGNADPHVGEALSNLAETLSLRGEYSKTEQLNRQALQIASAWYGEDHPQTASMMAHLGSTLMYEKKLPEAQDWLQRALAIQDKNYGTMGPRVAFVLNSLGSVSKQLGDFAAAEADYRRVIEIYRAAYGDSDYRVAIGISNLASVYLAEKDYGRAEPMFREVLQRLEKVLPAENINIAIAKIKLGRTLLGERRYGDAEQYSRSGYDSLIKQSSPSTVFVQYAREDLAAEYDDLRRPQDARRFRDELRAAR